MSLALDIDRITAVLLADGWHAVADYSFTIDAYEYLWGAADREPVLLGGQDRHITASGFQFRSTGNDLISGPLTSVLAVRTER